MQITPQVFRIKGMSNQYLIRDGSELTLIDTGVPNSVKTILDFIKSVGFQSQNLKRILITHSDPDHIGGISGLMAENISASVFASAIEANVMQTGNPSRKNKPAPPLSILFRFFGLFSQPPKLISFVKLVEGGEILPILGGLQVISSPGHTPGHISFFLPEQRILFAGDSINNKNGKPGPNLSFLSDNLELTQKSFISQMALNPLVIGCGHAYFDFRK